MKLFSKRFNKKPKVSKSAGWINRLFSQSEPNPNIMREERLVAVPNDAILGMDFSAIDAMERLVLKDIRRAGLQPWTLTLSGYDSDAHPLFDIPEVRSYCAELHQHKPHLLVLLDEQKAWWYPLCVLGYTFTSPPDGGVEYCVEHGEMKRFTDALAAGAAHFVKNNGLRPDDPAAMAILGRAIGMNRTLRSTFCRADGGT